jgi:hypothetical protein
MDNEQNKSLSWFAKYCPIKIDDLVGNRKSVELIVTWMNNYKKNKKMHNYNKTLPKKKRKTKKACSASISNYSSILITGNHGCGKTISIEVILESLGFVVHKINFNVKSKHVQDILKNASNTGDILGLLNGEGNDKKVIMIDKIETITSSTEKNCIQSLIKENNKFWYYPAILISNNKHCKLLTEIKKSAFEIKFYNPYPSEMRFILAKVARGEKMKFQNRDVLNGIIEHSQLDITRLISILQDIKYVYGKNVITEARLAEYKTISKQKDVNYDIFNATDGLLYNYENIQSCLRYYETEKTVIPLMMHQYYPQCLVRNHTNNNRISDLAIEISDSLSWGDIVENFIHGDQNWNMKEIHGFYTCVNTSFNICNGMKKEKNRFLVKYPSDLNKASIKQINKKNINNANKCFSNMNIIDYIYMNTIIERLIRKNDIDACIKLLKGYNIKLEHIESLMKIDKIKLKKKSNKTKVFITSKQKREFVAKFEKNIE